MTEVTDILRARMDEPSGLERMAVVSLAAHILFFAVFLLAPGTWLARTADEPRTVMTISLGGGGEGPKAGGMTSMGGRPTQVAEPAPKPEAIRPPAAKAPEMTVPTAKARPAKAASTAVKQAPDEARGRTPTRGAEQSAGSAVAVTGARGQGFGLSTGGGPGVGSTLDVADFCCPEYLATMIQRITANWNQQQNVEAVTVIRFTIRRDGTLDNIMLERSSGFPIPDLAAQRAVTVTARLPPLPNGYPTLGVHLTFQYQR